MMLVDCQTCPVRELHCADCVVTALTQLPFPTRNESPDRHDLGVAGSHGIHDSPSIYDNPRSLDGPGAGSTIQAAVYPPDSVLLDRAERRAVSILATVGLVDHDTAEAARAVLDTGRRLVPVMAVDAHRRAI